MTVYVDDSGIPATVGRHTSRWSHLFADSPDELHEFAGRLGLRRSYFQPGRPRGDGTPSRHWHYDVTSGKRMRAIQLGAVPVGWRESVRIMRERDERNAVARGPEASPQEHAAMADQWAREAGLAYRAGDTERAALLVQAAAQAGPARSELWAQRRARVLERASRQPLAVQAATRLAAAGIGPDDPAYRRLCEHNRLRRQAQAETAGPQADGDREAAP
jgi:Protein of unknown function (DUF4031)